MFMFVVEYGIFGEGSQISGNHKRESTDYSLQKFRLVKIWDSSPKICTLSFKS